MRRTDPTDPSQDRSYNPAYAPSTPGKKSLKPVWLLLAVLLVICAVFCGVGALLMGANGSPSPQPSETPRPAAGLGVPDPGVRPSLAPTPSKKPIEAITMGDGKYLVGDDIPAGTYKSKGAEESAFQYCGWTVKSGEDTGDEFVDAGSANKVNAPQRVKLKRGQLFETSGCSDWKRQP